MAHRAISAVLIAAASSFAAISVSPPARAENTASQLEEITVTATRRETNLQTTPVSVSSIGGDLLQGLRVDNIGQLVGVVPNFSPAKVTGFNAAGFAIRGTSLTDIIVYYEPPVGVVVDDFVLPSAQTQLLEPFDVEDVQILRGPQGTLFGKNTTGGVVSVRTKKPELGYTGGEVRYGFGSFGRRGAKAAANIAIGDTWALRASGSFDKSDGYYKNSKCYQFPMAPQVCGDGTSVGGEDILYGRVKLRWQPNENFDATLQYEYLKDRSDSPPAINETPPPSAGPPTAPLFFNFLGFPGITGGDPLKQAGVTNRDDGLRMRDGHRIDVDGLYLNMDWKLGNYTLTSVTGYREQDSRLPSTYTGEVYSSLFDASRDDNRQSFQQELRVASDLDGRFNFVAGAFYQTDQTDFQVLQYVGIFDIFGLTFPANFNTFTSINNCITIQATGGTCFNNTNAKLVVNNQDQRAWALFAEGTYEVTDRFNLTVGARWTDEKKDFTSRLASPLRWYLDAGGPGTSYYFDANDTSRFPCSPKLPCSTTGDSWSEPSWKLTGDYRVTDEIYGFATISRGFKSGGYNDQTGSALGALPLASYQPEFATSYEVGVKSDLLDKRLRLNATIFQVDYKDLQRSTVVAIGADQETRTFNAASATVRGLELEMTAIVSDRFALRGSLGYLDAKYDRFIIDVNGNGIIDGANDQDLSGRDVARAPKLTAGLDATYKYPVSFGELRFNANVAHEAKNTFYYSSISPLYDTNLQAKTLLGATITLSGTDDKWFAAVYGRNLSDERYRTASQVVGQLWTFATYGAPREYGVEFGLKIGE